MVITAAISGTMLVPGLFSRECTVVYAACPEESDCDDVGEKGASKDEATLDQMQRSKLEDLEDSHVRFEEDMYDAVTVAAFGQLILELPTERIHIHPVWMFVLSAPLFGLQQAALLYLRLSQDLGAPVHNREETESLQAFLPLAKTLMIYTMALMLFPELLGALRLMMFLVNPTTWTDIERYKSEWLPCIWSPFCVCPVSLASEMLKFCVGYVVLTDSVSIVLACNSVQDTIFNSLALTFLVELDNKLWEVARSVFHLRYEGEQFKLRPEAERDATASQVWGIRPRSWLHRKHGAAALEACFTSAVFMFCYCRQFLITEYSLRTDTLPMARDMCTLWELTNKNSWVGELARCTLRLMCFGAHPNGLLQMVCDPLYGGYCSPKFRRIELNDMYEVILAEPTATISNMVTFAVVLLIPQIFQLAFLPERGEDQAASPVRQGVHVKKMAVQKLKASY
ncbi:unnamed protein product [Durusdinium trenchii]|uniref:Uncharacterized protein n=2 Tax=Durusdinium trenchii TaxID=1381693 RepID=A0ABP0MKD1_9DINO